MKHSTLIVIIFGLMASCWFLAGSADQVGPAAADHAAAHSPVQPVIPVTQQVAQLDAYTARVAPGEPHRHPPAGHVVEQIDPHEPAQGPERGGASIGELIADVFAQRTDIEAAERVVEELEHREDAILCGMLPQSEAYGYLAKFQNSALPWMQLGIHVEQTLFDMAGPVLQQHKAAHDTQVARIMKLSMQYDARHEVERAAIDLWKRNLEYDLQQALKVSSVDTYQSALLQSEVGLLSDPDFEKSRAEFQNSASRISAYPHEISFARYGIEGATEKRFERALPCFPDFTKTLTYLLNRPCWDTEEIVKEGYANSTDLPRLEQEIESAEDEVDLDRYSYIPSISGFAEAYKSRFERPVVTNIFPWRAGVRVDWTFDGFANMHRAREARAKKWEKIFLYKRTEFDIRQEVTQADQAFKISVESLKASLAQAAKQREFFRKEEKAFSVGLRSEVQFAQSVTAWHQAQFDVIRGTMESATRYVELIYEMGYPPNRPPLFPDKTCAPTTVSPQAAEKRRAITRIFDPLFAKGAECP